MPPNEIDYEAIRKRAEKRANERVEFLIHLAVYVIVNVFLWALGAVTSSIIAFPWPALVSLGWGIGLAIHGAKVYLEGGVRDRLREQAIRREIELEKLRLGLTDVDPAEFEKPKRQETRIQLGDDGELIESDADEPLQADRRNSKSSH